MTLQKTVVNMKIFIMRHGEAEFNAKTDAQRFLSLFGREQARRMAYWLNKKSINFDQVLVSPYLRAQQTLEVLREILVLPKNQKMMSELTPGGDPEWISHYLKTLAKKGYSSVLLISHLPLVDYLVSEFCPKQSPPVFHTAAMTHLDLDIDKNETSLNWHITPAQAK